MVTPVEEPQDEQDDVVVPEMEVEEVSVSSPLKFDFAVENADNPNLKVYTVSTKPPEEEEVQLVILAPNYGAALEMAGVQKDNTVKVSEEPYEG